MDRQQAMALQQQGAAKRNELYGVHFFFRGQFITARIVSGDSNSTLAPGRWQDTTTLQIRIPGNIPVPEFQEIFKETTSQRDYTVQSVRPGIPGSLGNSEHLVDLVAL